MTECMFNVKKNMTMKSILIQHYDYEKYSYTTLLCIMNISIKQTKKNLL